MRFGSLLVLAIPAIVACGGGGPDESVSGVFPSSAFLGRQVRVEISGDVTEWKPGTSVDFGAGVTVQNVAVASPTALFADITVLPDAAPGLRDVTVTSGGDTLLLKEAFQLESAISLKFKGTVAQGSIATFAINNHDFETPFDDTMVGGGLFGPPPSWPNTTIEGPAGVTFQVDSMSPYAITGVALFDLDAAPGPISVASGLEADLITSSLGVDLDVKARTATALAANAAASGTVETTFASALYEFTGGAASLVTFDAKSNNGAGQPQIALLGPSGRFDEFVAIGPKNSLVMMQPVKLYGIMIDMSGTFGYPFSVKANSQTLTQVPENEAGNNTSAAAPMLTTMPTLVTNATLASKTDADWYALTITAADVGKTLRILTTGSDPQTDTVVQVFKAGTGGVAEEYGDASEDVDYHEDFTSEPLDAAGKYWVKITASSYFQVAHKDYAAAVWLE